MEKKWIIGTIVTVLVLAGPCIAASQQNQRPQGGGQEQLRTMDQEAYGWQLMDEQERQTYRERMQQMKTEEEREALRREHHELMQDRARRQGVTLPDEPGPHGKGMGPGRNGQGQGMGPGGGGGRR